MGLTQAQAHGSNFFLSLCLRSCACACAVWERNTAKAQGYLYVWPVKTLVSFSFFAWVRKHLELGKFLLFACLDVLLTWHLNLLCLRLCLCLFPGNHYYWLLKEVLLEFFRNCSPPHETVKNKSLDLNEFSPKKCHKNCKYPGYKESRLQRKVNVIRQ